MVFHFISFYLPSRPEVLQRGVVNNIYKSKTKQQKWLVKTKNKWSVKSGSDVRNGRAKLWAVLDRNNCAGKVVPFLRRPRNKWFVTGSGMAVHYPNLMDMINARGNVRRGWYKVITQVGIVISYGIKQGENTYVGMRGEEEVRSFSWKLRLMFGCNCCKWNARHYFGLVQAIEYG